jgi:hypothetical protein
LSTLPTNSSHQNGYGHLLIRHPHITAVIMGTAAIGE